nr:hypothetical protein [Tanacetum cinerariifolium]
MNVMLKKKEDNVNSTKNVNTVSSIVNAAGTNEDNELSFDPNMPALEDVSIFNFLNDDKDDDMVADMNNINTTIQFGPILTTRIHKDHPLDQEELLESKLQEVWTLVDLPNGKRVIGTKWVFMNKKDEKGIVIRNKARLVAQGHTQDEEIDYDKVFAPVARIEAIRLFLAYASFKDFVVYQMDVKSVFLYRKIEEEVYVCQPPGFEDLDFPDRVYKVKKALYELHQAPRACSTRKELCNVFERLMHEKFQLSSMGEITFFLGLQVKQKKDGIFISQDKYVDEILKKFRSMIGSLMYFTSSRPDIMFAVCACARYQVNPKVSHLYAVKRIFRASLDRKSTIGGCQFFRCRLISWQCKKQTVVKNSITEAEYVAASSCCGQVLWIRNKLLDYGYNFMHTKIFIDNNSTICTTYYCWVNVNAVEEQFWSTVVAKTINGEAQIHARVDGKKVIISKASIRRDLQYEDEEGVNCLPNSTIFEQLASIGMGRNLDNLSGKFLMYPRFIQVFLDKQIDRNSNHERKYVSSSHTKKFFRNMRRIKKGFSRRITPLFPTMVVQSQLGEGSAMPTDPYHTPIILQSSSSQPQKTHKPRKPTRKVTKVPQPSEPMEHVADEAVHKKLGECLVRTATTASSLEAEQDSGNINRTQSKATTNDSISQETSLGSGSRCQKAMGDTIAQTRFGNVSKLSNDSLLVRGNTL